MIEILKISLIAYMFTILGEEGRIFHWYQKLIGKLPEWIKYPLGGCFLCFVGQVCFWYYLIFMDGYNFFEHLFFASAGIFISMIYNKIYQFIKP